MTQRRQTFLATDSLSSWQFSTRSLRGFESRVTCSTRSCFSSSCRSRSARVASSCTQRRFVKKQNKKKTNIVTLSEWSRNDSYIFLRVSFRHLLNFLDQIHSRRVVAFCLFVIHGSTQTFDCFVSGLWKLKDGERVRVNVNILGCFWRSQTLAPFVLAAFNDTVNGNAAAPGINNMSSTMSTLL